MILWCQKLQGELAAVPSAAAVLEPLNLLSFRLYKSDREMYYEFAKEWTKKYAMS